MFLNATRPVRDDVCVVMPERYPNRDVPHAYAITDAVTVTPLRRADDKLAPAKYWSTVNVGTG